MQNVDDDIKYPAEKVGYFILFAWIAIVFIEQSKDFKLF